MKRLFLVLAASLASTVLAAQGPPAYGLDVDIRPSPDSKGYVCNAQITDLESGEVISAPMIRLTSDATVTTQPEGSDVSYELKVLVESQGSRATTQLKVSRGDAVLARQRSTLAIR
jgi:hypothetical protein